MSPLIDFAGNPGPAPRLGGHVETPDGFRLRYALFRSPVRPNRGSVVLLQGRNEAIEKYLETIDDITRRGFDLCTFDWRGQGGSTRFFADGRRGYVDDFRQYGIDLDTVFSGAFLAEARPPFFVLAHSTGALVALDSAPTLANRVDRMMLAAPFLGLSPDGPPLAVLDSACRALCYLGLGRIYMGGGPRGIAALELATNRLTTDPRRFARNQAIMDPANGLGLGSATAAWLRAAIAAIRRVHDENHMARIHVPTLMVVAGADRVVSVNAIDDYARRMRAATQITIAGARHELMQEADRYRDQFWAAFDAFIPGSSG